MNYLLDTHTLIWAITDNKKSLGSVREEIKNLNNECLVSIASCWEIGIKLSLKKLELNSSLNQIFETITLSAFKILPIAPDHIIQVSKLQLHHRDPFDRLIIAQAMVENLTIITKDREFSQYDVNIKWT